MGKSEKIGRKCLIEKIEKNSNKILKSHEKLK